MMTLLAFDAAQDSEWATIPASDDDVLADFVTFAASAGVYWDPTALHILVKKFVPNSCPVINLSLFALII